jgi:hypothetical protein
MAVVASAFVVAGLAACLVLASPIGPVQPVVEGMDGVDGQCGEQASSRFERRSPPIEPTVGGG